MTDWQEEYAKASIQLLEHVRKGIMLLDELASKLRPDLKHKIGSHADSLKDYREVLEEFIEGEYDVGK